MKLWTTTIMAIDPRDGKLKRWMGPEINALTRELAQEYCQKNELGYCSVDEGEVTGIIPAKLENGHYVPLWDQEIDFTKPEKN